MSYRGRNRSYFFIAIKAAASNGWTSLQVIENEQRLNTNVINSLSSKLISENGKH